MPLTALKQQIEALKAFDFGDELERIVSDNKERITELQKEQLYSGKGIDNGPILLDGKGYSPVTIKIKRRRGEVTDRVTWKSSGALYQSLFTEVRSRAFSVESNSFKFAKMKLRSGNAVGLNEGSRTKFATEITLPRIREVFFAKSGWVIN